MLGNVVQGAVRMRNVPGRSVAAGRRWAVFRSGCWPQRACVNAAEAAVQVPRRATRLS